MSRQERVRTSTRRELVSRWRDDRTRGRGERMGVRRQISGVRDPGGEVLLVVRAMVGHGWSGGLNQRETRPTLIPYTSRSSNAAVTSSSAFGLLLTELVDWRRGEVTDEVPDRARERVSPEAAL